MLGEILKKLRKEQGMTQTQFAIKIGTKQTTYSNWENDSRDPDIETIIKIADYYKISTDYLLGRLKENK